jgi:uncharacterized membrane protein
VRNARLALRDVVERARGSLFLVPSLFLLGGTALAAGALAVDEHLADRRIDLPLVVTTTVDSSRAVLSTIASATMTVAGIAFSVALLVFQLASSQYSPRVIHGMFRDGFNKRVIGLVVGTFAYCLIVLRSVRSEVDDIDASAVVPTVSVNLAVLLGIITVLAIVGFIDHSAHRMDISRILAEVAASTVDVARGTWPRRADREDARDPDDARDSDETGAAEGPPQDAARICFDSDGWIQQLDSSAVIEALPPSTTARLEIAVGRYAISGAPICTVWPAPEDLDAATRRIRGSVRVGPERTLAQDAAYGVRQLVDVALIALSSGVNDPTTAQDAIFHLAGVLAELLVRDPPDDARTDDDGRQLLAPERVTHDELVDLAYDEIRRAARTQPRVCSYLLSSIGVVLDATDGRTSAAAEVALRRQADLVMDELARADALPQDLARVRSTYRRKFG